jgi:hypothetical protein
MLANPFLQVKWFQARLKLREKADAKVGVKLRPMRIKAPDDEVAKSERFFDCTSRPEVGERSPEKQMSGRCAQNDEASQGDIDLAKSWGEIPRS